MIAVSAYPSSASSLFGSTPTKASRLHPLLAFVFAGVASTLATSTQAHYTIQTLADTATEQRTEQTASGTNRLQSHCHTPLSDEQAAALPLTTITAYELLFDRLGVAKGGGAGQTLLVVGGAGGVGSILIQLARQLTQLRVVATASRPETRQWCLDLGAHVVIDHSRPLAAELKAAGVEGVELVASLTRTLQHYPQIIEALKPQGRLGVIDDMQGLDAMPLKSKALSLHWELMFTRPMYETPDMAEQGALLAEVAALVDTGRIRSTASTSFGTINAQNLRKAHALIESGKAHGKVVLAGF